MVETRFPADGELFQIVRWRAAPDFDGHEEWSSELKSWVVSDQSQTSDDIAILTTRKKIARRTFDRVVLGWCETRTPWC